MSHELGAQVCQAPYCDRLATVAAHALTTTSILFRTDHLTEPFVADWRCLDCAVGILEEIGGQT